MLTCIPTDPVLLIRLLIIIDFTLIFQITNLVALSNHFILRLISYSYFYIFNTQFLLSLFQR